MVTVKQVLAVNPAELTKLEKFSLGLPKRLLLPIQFLNELRHAIRVQLEGCRLAGKTGYEFLQPYAASLGKISAAGKG